MQHITIAGGGLTGASFALLALNKLMYADNYQISLIESQPFCTSNNPSFDDKISVLSYKSILIYKSIGIWDKILQQATPIYTINVGEKHYNQLVMKSHGITEAFGYVVANTHLGRCLYEKISEYSQENKRFTLIQDEIKNIQAISTGYCLRLNSNTHKTNLLVLANGGNNKHLTNSLAIDTKTINYKQSAVVATIEVERSLPNTAFEFFSKHGPMALLPLDNNKYALVFSISSEKCNSLLQLSDESFLELAQNTFGNTLGKWININKPITYSLLNSVSTEQIRNNLVLLGNVAHTMHPVAGLGFNLCLKDAYILADTIFNNNQLDYSLNNLQNYVNKRINDQKIVMGFSDCLVNTFTSQNQILKYTRNIGLNVFNNIQSLKTIFVKKAVGI